MTAPATGTCPICGGTGIPVRRDKTIGRHRRTVHNTTSPHYLKPCPVGTGQQAATPAQERP